MKFRTLLPALMLFVSSLAAADYQAYVGEANGNFDLLDITTGVHTLIGNNGQGYSGLAFAPNGTLYATTVSSSASVLSKVNPLTGANTVVGNTGLGITVFASLTDGSFYGVDTADRLISINPATGASTVVGATGLPTLSFFDNSLASDGIHLYYTLGTNNGDDFLYSLNRSTGAATLIGDTGVTDIVGSVFAATTSTNGTLFGFGTGDEIYKINTASGATSILGSSGIDDYYGGVGLSVPQASTVPEPATVSLLAFGVLIYLSQLAVVRRYLGRMATRERFDSFARGAGMPAA